MDVVIVTIIIAALAWNIVTTSKLRLEINLLRFQLEERIVAILDPILERVTEIEGKADSLIALVNELAALLRANAADPAAIQAIADRLQAQSGEIQAALDANSPPVPPA